MESTVTPELLEAIKNKIDILMEAIEAEQAPGKQISYRTQAATGAFDPHPGGGVQIIVEVCVNEDYFLADGDIAVITEHPYAKRPYKTIKAKDEQN